MKWIKASERLPEQPERPDNPPLYLCRFHSGRTEDCYMVDYYSAYIMQDIKRENDWEWLDESPSPLKGVEEAAEAYRKEHAQCFPDAQSESWAEAGFVDGWNARHSQGVLLTKEEHQELLEAKQKMEIYDKELNIVHACLTDLYNVDSSFDLKSTVADRVKNCLEEIKTIK